MKRMLFEVDLIPASPNYPMTALGFCPLPYTLYLEPVHLICLMLYALCAMPSVIDPITHLPNDYVLSLPMEPLQKEEVTAQVIEAVREAVKNA